MPSNAERGPGAVGDGDADASGIERFDGHFLDSYPDRASFIQAQRDTHGWPDAEDLFEPDLEMGDERLWRDLCLVYDVRHEHGGVFVWRSERTADGPRRPAAAPERLTSLEPRMERIARGLEQWSDAFLAYLQLPDVDLDDEQIGAHFIDSYAGYYESRKALIDAQLDSLGWHEALDAFRADQGIWDDDLRWNYDALWAHCCDVYTTNERLGGVHAFFM